MQFDDVSWKGNINKYDGEVYLKSNSHMQLNKSNYRRNPQIQFNKNSLQLQLEWQLKTAT